MEVISIENSKAKKQQPGWYKDSKTSNKDVSSILSMLSYKRPHGSASEAEFIRIYLDKIPQGVEIDGFGNHIVQIGESRKVAWSCHVDTVHRESGTQKLYYDGRYIRLAPSEKGSRCLGADDGAGVWLLLEMIAANVPGLYIFHRGEEKGGLGSQYIAHNTPELLSETDYIIAFDRKGTGSIITHQLSDRCCSEAFADSLANALKLPHLRSDDTGTFTDTAYYTDLVSECTNVSVGYENEHRESEYLDLAWLVRLRDALCKDFAPSLLKASRTPGESEWERWEDEHDYTWKNQDWSHSTRRGRKSKQTGDLMDVVQDHPQATAALLEDCGLTAADIQAYIVRGKGF